MRTARPSRTARKVALNILALGARRAMAEVLPRGIVDATARLLVASGVVSRRVVDFARTRRAAGIYLAFDWLMPGQFEAFAHRKAFLEQQVRKGIEAGAGQVLVLGAGYDTLGWRLAAEFGGVNFFEIDQPATASLKARGIEVMGARPNLHLLAEDLSEQRLEDVLRATPAWDSTAPTVIVAEGLLMYLPAGAVRALFEQCAAVTGPGSRIAFTYVGERSGGGGPDAGPWTWLLLWLLKISGEPWLWSIQPQALEAFLKETHWTIAPSEMDLLNKCGIEFFGVVTR